MYRQQQKKLKINFLFNNGGIGDLIGSLPALNYIHKNHPHVYQQIWIGDFGKEFAERSLPRDERIIVHTFSNIDKYDQNTYTRCIGYGSTYTNLSSHITKHAFSMICNVEPEVDDLNYLPMDQRGLNISRLNLPEKYVVINVGHTAAVREWKPKYITEVAKYIKEKGYTPVFIGKAAAPNGAGHVIRGTVNEGVDFSLGMDIRDQTTLCELQVVISKAKTIVGLDCGPLHVAATTEIPIVGAFTSVKPMHRMPYRHGQLGWNYYPIFLSQKELGCTGCQSNMAFTPVHRFDTCLHKDRLCLDLITPDKYIAELEKIL